MLLLVTTVRAADLSWNTTSGAWDEATNWTPQEVPVGGDDNVTIANNGACNFTNTAAGNAQYLTVGNGDDGSLTVKSGSTLTVGHSSYAGLYGSSAALTVEAGSTLDPGGGNLHQWFGTLVGNAGQTNRLTMDVYGTYSHGDGNIDFFGAYPDHSSYLYDVYPRNAACVVELNIHPGAVVVFGAPSFGHRPNSHVTVNQTGGTVTTRGNYWLALGYVGGEAEYNLSGGTVTVNQHMYVNALNGTGNPCYFRISGNGVLDTTPYTGTQKLWIGNDGAAEGPGTFEVKGGDYTVTCEDFQIQLRGTLRAVVKDGLLTNINASGTATLSAGSQLDVAFDGAETSGSWLVIDAASMIDNGIAFAPGVDTDYDDGDGAWSYEVNGAQGTLTIFYGEGAVSLPPQIDNGLATDIMTDSAVLHGELVATGGVPTQVWVYWGPTDGSDDPNAWANTNALGTFAEGPVSNVVSGLDPGVMYYFSFVASNEAGRVWAEPSVSFGTRGASTEYTAVITNNPYVVKYWSFDEAGTVDAIELIGGNVADYLAPQNSATRAASTDTAGEVSLGSAVSLPSNGDHFATPGTVTGSKLTGPWALEFWFKCDNLAGRDAAVVNMDGGATGSVPDIYWDWAVYPPDNSFFGYNRSEGTPAGQNTGPVIDDTLWHHVVLADFGGTDPVAQRINWYVDGVLAATTDTNMGNFWLGSARLRVGGMSGSYTMEGKLDEVAVYDMSSLSTVQDVEIALLGIAGHYYAGLDVVPPSVGNLAASDITVSAATLNGTLAATGSAPAEVWLYWGPMDGTNNPAAWANTNYFGTNTMATPAIYSNRVTGLTPDTTYYYRFVAANTAGTSWAQPTMSFQTRVRDSLYSRAIVGNPYAVKYWRFDEASGNAVEVIGGLSGDDLIPTGGATRAPSGKTGGGAPLGRAAKMFADGDCFKSVLGLSGDNINNAYAIEFWIKPDDLDTGGATLLQVGGASTPDILWDLGGGHPDNRMLSWHRTAPVAPIRRGADIANTNIWHHVVVGDYLGVADRCDWFVNGQIVTNTAGLHSTTGPQLAAGSLSLGGTSPVDYGSIIGLMDELAIYDLGSLTNSIQIEMALENIAAHYDLGSGTGALLIVK